MSALALMVLPVVLQLPALSGWLVTNPLFYQSHVVGPQLALGHSDALLPGYPWLDPNAGWTTWSFGSLAARLWSQGVVPWWNPYSGVGLPLAAEGQTPALFMPLVFLLLSSNGLIYIKVVLQIGAGISSLAFLRQIGIRRSVALTGALLFELNGTFAVMSDQPIMPVAFLPLMLFGVERARQHAEQNLPGGWRWLAVALAASLYAGFPETAYLDGLFVATWCIARLASMKRPIGWRFSIHILAGLGFGLLLALPILVPFLELVSLSTVRDPLWFIHVIGRPNTLTLMLPAATMPYLFGPPDYRDALLLHCAWAGYITLPALMVAIAGLMTHGRLAIRMALALFVVLAIARVADIPLLSEIVNVLPSIRGVLVARYIWPALEMGGIVATCLYLEWRCSNGAMGPLRRQVPVVIVVLVAAASLWQAAAAIGQQYHAGHGYVWFVCGSLVWAVLTCAVVAFLIWSGKTYSAGAIGAVLVIDAAVFFVLPTLSAARPAALDTTGLHFLQDHLGFARYVTLGPVPANYGAAFELASVNFNTEPTPRIWTAGGGGAIAWNTLGKPVDAVKARWLESYGVKYVVVAPDKPLRVSTELGAPAPKVFSGATMDIYELPSPAPYVQSIGEHCAVDIRGRNQVDIVCTRPGTLLRRELMYPGWQAAIDGKPAHLDTCGIYQCLSVPSGAAHVSFSFAPSHTRASTAAGVVALMGILLGAVRRAGQPRNERKTGVDVASNSYLSSRRRLTP